MVIKWLFLFLTALFAIDPGFQQWLLDFIAGIGA